MKIVLFKGNEILPNKGGISRINFNLKESLCRIGYTIYFLSTTKSGSRDVDKCQIWLPDTNSLGSQENVDFLRNYIISEAIDVIINNNFDKASILFLANACRETNCKIITWVHNNIVEFLSKVGFRKERQLRNKHLTLIYKLITTKASISFLRFLGKRKHHQTAKMLYDLSDKVVVVSDSNVNEFKYLIGDADEQSKIISINNFVLRQQDDLDLSDKEKSVVWCGNVDFELKKTNWMLEIWKIVQARHKDWTLTIMGDSNQLESMKEYANRLNVDRVVFVGRVNPFPYYNKASILCSTSISESFGLTLVEGMQRKVVPIAFSSSPAIRDIVGNNGCLVKPYNIQLFAKTLSMLMDNDNQRGFLAEKGRIAVLQYEDGQIVKLWHFLLQMI